MGYGYVQYESPHEAENALKNLNHFEIKGKKISVERFTKLDEREEEEKFPLVFIKQLPPSVLYILMLKVQDDRDLEKIFTNFGMVSYCAIIQGRENEPNMGVVLFNSREDAQIAIKTLNDSYLTNDTSGVKILLSMYLIN